MNKSNILILLFVFLISCNSQSQITNNFDFEKADFVKLNEKKLNQIQIEEIEKSLNKLKEVSKETYSKPKYIIRYNINGESLFISIFKKEKFVYKGYFLESWSDRMRGKKSSGFGLSKDLKKILDKL